MELSKKVKALRKKQGLSQLELAEKIFVSRQAISGWEAGTSRPSTENLQCLSKLYAVPLEVLLDDKQELEFGGDKQSEPVIPQKQRKKKCVSIIIGFIIILLFGITLFQFWKKNSNEMPVDAILNVNRTRFTFDTILIKFAEKGWNFLRR